jgi:hypothetical protein
MGSHDGASIILPGLEGSRCVPSTLALRLIVRGACSIETTADILCRGRLSLPFVVRRRLIFARTLLLVRGGLFASVADRVQA